MAKQYSDKKLKESFFIGVFAYLFQASNAVLFQSCRFISGLQTSLFIITRTGTFVIIL